MCIQFEIFNFSSVQSYTDWVVGGTRAPTEQRSSSILSYGRLSRVVLSWAWHKNVIVVGIKILNFCIEPVSILSFFLNVVSTGSSSCGGDVAVYVFDMNQPSLPTPFYSVLVSVSDFMALSTVFHSINSPYNSLLSHSVLLVLFLPYWYFQLYMFL